MRVPDLPLHPTGPPPPTGPPLPPPGPQPPPGAPAVSVVPPMPKTSPTALIALVLAALSFLYCPVVFAVVALVLARQAETDIAESHGWVTGSGLVTGARVAAWINIGLSAVVLVGLAVVLAVAPGSR